MRYPKPIAKFLSKMFPNRTFHTGSSWTDTPVVLKPPKPEPLPIRKDVPMYKLRPTDSLHFAMIEMVHVPNDTNNPVRYRLLCVEQEKVITVDRTLFELLFTRNE